METTQFLLIRHGTNDLVGKTIAGRQPGVHLNARGQVQAAGLVDFLVRWQVQVIVSSPLERAMETAAPLAERLGLKPEKYSDLQDIDFGDWTGRLIEDLKSEPGWPVWNNCRSACQIPNGETILDVQQRMVRTLGELCRKHQGKTVAVFSHADPIKTVLAYYLGMPLDMIPRLDLRPASVSLLTLGDWGVRVGGINLALCD